MARRTHEEAERSPDYKRGRHATLSRMIKGFLSLLLLSFFILMTGCEEKKEDRFEKAGKQLDKAVKDLKEKLPN
jgi:hypothetical protein